MIITIIVIIILAVIVIFNGFGTTDSAQFAKFVQEYSSYGEEVQQRYMYAKVKSSLEGISKTDKVIYSEIGDGTEVSVSTALNGKSLLGGNLEGTVCYKLPDDKRFYQDDCGSYVTEKGEIFTYPGYRYKVNGEERRYVNATMYYMGDSSAATGGNTDVDKDYGAVVVEDEGIVEL